MDQVIALALRRRFACRASLFRGPDKQIDEVLPATVKERRYSSVVQVFQPAAKERKFLTGQVFDWRREIQLAVEPGLHGMRILRNHIDPMIFQLQRADVIGNY